MKEVSNLLNQAISANREFVRSFQSTTNKDKYYKIVDRFHATLELKDSLEDTWVLYMSKPRVLQQGQKTIDLRVDTPAFKQALFAWLKTYPNDFDEIESSETISPNTKLPIIPGLSRKQIAHVIKHKNMLSQDKIKEIQKITKNIESTGDPLLDKLKLAFQEGS